MWHETKAGKEFIAKASKLNRKGWFKLVLKTFPRVAIAGGPNTGKTTLSRMVGGRPVYHTDDHRGLAWEAVPHAVIAEVLDQTGGGREPFVVEGVQVPRTLRKGLVVDAVVWLDEPLEEESKGQATMRKGCATVLADWFKDNKDVPVLQAPRVSQTQEE